MPIKKSKRILRPDDGSLKAGVGGGGRRSGGSKNITPSVDRKKKASANLKKIQEEVSKQNVEGKGKAPKKGIKHLIKKRKKTSPPGTVFKGRYIKSK